MSKELVKDQINRFLSSENPEVLAIKGDWGVGKTFFWNNIIKEYKNKCSLKKYAYVSLFGIQSIDDIKKSILLNSVDTNNIGKQIDWKKQSTNISNTLINLSVGGLKLGDVLTSISQVTTENIILCFDDLERHSKGVTTKDIMGLISYLKEEKNCKIVILLNEDSKDEILDEYRKFKEKIIEREIHFSPTPEECFDTIYSEEFNYKRSIRKYCILLKIKNMRVIKKIVNICNEYLKILNKFDDDVKEDIIKSIVLLSWCYYLHSSDEDKIPDFNYARMSANRNVDESLGWKIEKVKSWALLLSSYGFNYNGDLHEAIARSIEQGFLDVETVIPICNLRQSNLELHKINKEWDSAEKFLLNSFDSNEEDVASKYCKILTDIADFASSSQYNQGIKILRLLKKDQEADNLIDHFISKKGTSSIELKVNDSFIYKHYDPSFLKKMNDAYIEIEPKLSIEEIVTTRKGTGTYNESESNFLAQIPEDEIYEIFIALKGKDIIDYITVFRHLGNSNEELAKKVMNVLEKIGNTSALNKYRLELLRL
ncbi:P-loop NTPase fold protein [Shewanella algae]|uniref:P-loop NTPase fold protein n=1 Tax=Shewanella algae TaxID=38313 RepID=UPI003004FE50